MRTLRGGSPDLSHSEQSHSPFLVFPFLKQTCGLTEGRRDIVLFLQKLDIFKSVSHNVQLNNFRNVGLLL